MSTDAYYKPICDICKKPLGNDYVYRDADDFPNKLCWHCYRGWKAEKDSEENNNDA